MQFLWNGRPVWMYVHVCTSVQHKKSTWPEFARVFSSLQQLHRPVVSFVLLTSALQKIAAVMLFARHRRSCSYLSRNLPLLLPTNLPKSWPTFQYRDPSQSLLKLLLTSCDVLIGPVYWDHCRTPCWPWSSGMHDKVGDAAARAAAVAWASPGRVGLLWQHITNVGQRPVVP
jgi:hypothetical protein